MTAPKRVWIATTENSWLLSIDGFQGRVTERRYMDRFLSMFPDIKVKEATLYDLNFITRSGAGTAILNMTYDHLRDTLRDLSGRGLDLESVEGLKEFFPEGL